MSRTDKPSRRIPKENSATSEEIEAAIVALTPQEHLRLRSIAEWRIGGLGRAAKYNRWDDLLRDAIAATYDSTRGWNKEKVTFFHHLDGVMRSKSSHWRKKFNINEALNESDIIRVSPEGQESNPMLDVPAPGPDAQHTLELKEELEEIMRTADENTVAALIAGGLAEGMNGPEIRETLNISQTEYETAFKWLRRKVRPRNNRKGRS
jgi:hypothetical protein